jgi:hypothetical protein
MGQHDPLDGLITFLELQPAGVEGECGADLTAAIAEMTEMCAQGHWTTDDPLGIGGVLDNAARLAQLICEHKVERHELLCRLLIEAEMSLQALDHFLNRPIEHRLAFRELGLSIGIHGLQRLVETVARDRELAIASNRLLRYEPLGGQIEAVWSDPAHRSSDTWMDHRDINAVMLATSLAPESYLQL